MGMNASVALLPQSLKSEMEDYSQSTAEIESKISELKSRCLPLLPSQPCMLCDAAVFNRQFYLFPCRQEAASLSRPLRTSRRQG